MADGFDVHAKNARKFIEDEANETIERMLRCRDSYRRQLIECKQYIEEQVSFFFEGLEATFLQLENEVDELVKKKITSLVETLENIDTLLTEINTCKSTVSKLNSMLTGKENYN
ncbi:unnamed protein product [Trichobilharzia szidati]|nr:unnamed protein product [Trichobilharzia szidati]